MVWRTTTAPRTEVVKVSANNLTDGSLRWETVIWTDEESDEPYPGGGWVFEATFVDVDGIIYASDDERGGLRLGPQRDGALAQGSHGDPCTAASLRAGC